MIRGHYGEYIVQIKARRINRIDVIVIAEIVARRSDKDHPCVPCSFDRVIKSLGIETAAPRSIYDFGAVIDRVRDRFNRVAGEYRLVFREIVGDYLQGHQLDIPAGAGDTHAVVPNRTGDPGYVSAVKPVVVGIAVPVAELPGAGAGEIIAVNVVHVSVAVIVDAGRSILLGLVDPHIVRQVRVPIVDARIGNCDYDIGTARIDIPCIVGVDVGIRRAAGLARVIQRPLLGVIRVVGNKKQLVLVVRLGIQDVGRAVESSKSVQDACALGQSYGRQAGCDIVIDFVHLGPVDYGSRDHTSHCASGPRPGHQLNAGSRISETHNQFVRFIDFPPVLQ